MEIIRKINNIPIIIPLRILIFLLINLICIKIFYQNSSYINFDKKEVLSLLISVISIIIAIIITYIFSKLFAEKAERIQRKSEIDELSHKITTFRKIAFHIRGFYDFWKFGKNNIKSKMDRKYKTLVYEDIRNDRFTYDELTPIIDDVGEMAIQAYLGLKGLENNERTIHFFQSFDPKNYTLDEIARFEEYTGIFWSLLDRSSDKIVNLNKENEYSLNQIDELFFKITGRQIDKRNYNKEIKELFSYFQSEIFQKHYYLNKLNSVRIPKLFLSSLFNILVFICLLIASLMLFISNFNILIEYSSTIFIVSVFIANTVDLIILTFSALKTELKIDEFYRI